GARNGGGDSAFVHFQVTRAEAIRNSVAKVACKATGLGQMIATFEGGLEHPSPNTEGGMYCLNAACRDFGTRNGDHLLLSPRNGQIPSKARSTAPAPDLRTA
ncbi:unnamed protein product, partial [Symbiodinium sp. CCMP2456]